MNFATEKLWLIEPSTLTGIEARWREMPTAEIHAAQSAPAKPRQTYENLGGGLAIVNVAGVLLKSPDIFDQLLLGAISSGDIAAAVDAAASDASVQTILLLIDSPGGTVSGTGHLADAVYNAGKKKDSVSFISDKGASAAYWIASQAEKIYANSTAVVGAIGTYSVLIDASGRADQLGLKIHVVKAGEMKGLGQPGTKITPEQLAEVQRTVDAVQTEFTAGIARGRNWPIAKAAAMADGRVHVGQAAAKLGLIDAVDTVPAVIERLKAKSTPAPMPTATPRVASTTRASHTPAEFSRAFGHLVREEMQSGCTRQEAIGRIAKRSPELHREFLKATGGVAAADL